MHYYTHEKMAKFRDQEVARAAERRRQWKTDAAPGAPLGAVLRDRVTALMRLFRPARDVAAVPATAPDVVIVAGAASETTMIDPVWTSGATSPFDELDAIGEPAPVG